MNDTPKPFTSTWSPVNDVVRLARAVVAAAEGEGIRLELSDLKAALAELDSSQPTESEYDAAVAIHESDAVTVDADLVSHGDNGYWVSASVWVPVEENEGDKDDDGVASPTP